MWKLEVIYGLTPEKITQAQDLSDADFLTFMFNETEESDRVFQYAHNHETIFSMRRFAKKMVTRGTESTVIYCVTPDSRVVSYFQYVPTQEKANA